MNGKTTGGNIQTELVDIAWVARRLGVKVRHVRRLVSERRIPFVKWGHLLRFDPAEIEAWIDGVTLATGKLSRSRAIHVDSGVRAHGGLVDSERTGSLLARLPAPAARRHQASGGRRLGATRDTAHSEAVRQ